MKAVEYSGKGQLKVVNLPKPDLKNKQGAIIKLIGCGLCGSDIVKIKKDLVSPGTVLGHEVIGEIEEINSFENAYKKGDKVVIAHHVPCGNCSYCLQGSYSMCDTFKNTNLEPGGFSEYIFISDLHLKYTTVKVPDNISDIKATLMEPLGCILRALDRVKIEKNQNILIIGLGFVGLLFLEVIKGSGVKIFGCDINQERINLGRSSGADFVFNSKDINESLNVIRDNTDSIGADIVILASGATQSIDLALKLVRDGGKILVFASIPDENTGFMNNSVYYRELSIIGGYSSAPEYLLSAMNLLGSDKINVDKLCMIMDLEEINQAVDQIVSQKAMKVYLKV